MLIAVSDKGKRVGQSHPQAKLTDRDVELLLELHAAGWGYRRLARKFDVSSSQARNICLGRKRSLTVAEWRAPKGPGC